MRLKKVLLAEDDIDDADMFSSIVDTNPKIEMLPIAENGEAVFDILIEIESESLPDLIILDQNMPKRNGMQTLQLLKQHETYRHIPVVIYSTYVDDNLRRVCSLGGAVSIYSKPSTVEEYEAMVTGMLGILG